MSFDEIFDLTAGMYYIFRNILCKEVEPIFDIFADISSVRGMRFLQSRKAYFVAGNSRRYTPRVKTRYELHHSQGPAAAVLWQTTSTRTSVTRSHRVPP